MKNYFKNREKEALELINDPFYYYKKVTFLSLLLACIIIVPFLFVELKASGAFVFLYYGDYNVQQVPFYEHCVRMVHSGNIGWDWITDLGSNFVGSYSYYLLGSPFFWIMCLFPASFAPYLMGPIYILKFVTAAVISYAFFKRFVTNKEYAVIGALLYSFCGFQIYNVFFNQFHEVVALFPLLLIGMEELIQNNRRGLFAVSVALNCMCNYFMFAGQVVFCIIYFFVRCLRPSFRVNLRNFFILALEAVLGVLMGAVLFLPACLGVLGNYRLGYSFDGLKSMLVWEKSGRFYFERYGHIIQSLFFPPDIPSRVNFFFGHTARWSSNAAWIPVFGLSGVIAYLRQRKKSSLAWFVIVLIAFALVPVLNSTFFLFNTNYYARWMYMLVIIGIVVTLMALEDKRINWKFGIIFNTCVIAVISVFCGLIWNENINDVDYTVYSLGREPFSARLWASVAIALACMAALHVIIKRYRGTKAFTNALLLTVCVTIALYSIIHIACGKEHSTSTAAIVNDAIEGEVDLPKEDGEFYRIDFLRTSDSGIAKKNGGGNLKYTNVFDNLGISWEVPSVECFHSVVPPSIMEFYEKVGVTRNVASRAEYNKYGLIGFLSVKYSFVKTTSKSKHPTDNVDGLSFTYVGDQVYNESTDKNDYSVFENDYYVDMGFYFNEFITQTEFEKVAKSNRHTLLCKYLVVPDEEAEFYSRFMKEAVSSAGTVKNANQVVRESANYGTYVKSVKERQNCTASYFEYDSDSFRAEIDLSSDNVVMFTVPSEEGITLPFGIKLPSFLAGGWSAKVNGKAAVIHKVDYGFMAVECSGSADGHYVIEFSYSTPGLVPGIIITVLAVIAFVLYLLICRKKGVRASYRFFKEDYVEVECPEYDEIASSVEEAPKTTLFGKNSTDEENDAKTTCPTAKTAMILSLVGIPICGFAFGAAGIITAFCALKKIKEDKSYTGEKMAYLAILLGAFDVVLYAVMFAMNPTLLRAFSVFIT